MSRIGSHCYRNIILTRRHAVPRDVFPNNAGFGFQLLGVRAHDARGTFMGNSTRTGDRVVWHVLWFVQNFTFTSLKRTAIEQVFFFPAGFVISCAVDNERSATYLALGSFLPLIMLCGIIWPIEGMHPLLKAPALFLPLTKSTESLRSILQRGWPIDDSQVYIGFISTGIWILIFLTFSILLLKFKKG